MKKLILGILLSFTIFAQFERDKFVYDFSNIIEKNSLEKLNKTSKDIFDKTGIEFFILMDNNSKTGDFDTYFSETLDNLPYKNPDKVILIFVLKDNRYARIYRNDSLMGVLGNDDIEKIMQEVVNPFLNDKEFEKLFLNSDFSIANEIYGYSGIKQEFQVEKTFVKEKVPLSQPVQTVISIVVIILAIIFGGIFLHYFEKYRKKYLSIKKEK